MRPRWSWRPTSERTKARAALGLDARRAAARPCWSLLARPFTTLVMTTVLMTSGVTLAKPTKGRASDTSAPPLVPLPSDTIARLRSGDPVRIKAAFDDVRVSGKGAAAAVPAISELLERGLPQDLTLAAFDALGDTENEGGSEAVAWYTHDRDPAVRRAAVQTLGRTGGPAAAKSLRACLSDADPGVRGLAATGLGNIEARDAVADLFVALDHKVVEAAASIGQLCAGNECDRLASRLGGAPFDVVTQGLDQILFRNPDDVTDDLKIKIVGRVRELATPEANRFLRDVQAKWPKSGSARVRQAIDQAVLATNAAAGAPSP